MSNANATGHGPDTLALQARALLDEAYETVVTVDALETTIAQTEDAFGLAYPDQSCPEEGYQPAEAHRMLLALARQMRARAYKLLKQADTVSDFAERVAAQRNTK